jgi:DnaJ-class molecular chaperone
MATSIASPINRIAIREVSAMPDREEPRCPYCLGDGRLPKGQDILVAKLLPPKEWQTCLGCAGSGRLQADDWEVSDGPGRW